MTSRTDLRTTANEELRSTLSRYALAVRRRWKVGLLTLGVLGSISFWCSQYLPRQYQALTVFERRDDAVLQNLVSQNTPYSFEHLKSSLTLDLTGLRAKADAAVATGIVAPGTVAATGALSETEASEVKSKLARHKLNASVRLVTNSPGLDVIELRADANSPALARKYVAALRDQYIASARARMRAVLEDTRTFFQSELNRCQSDADAAAQAIDDKFKGLTDLQSRDPAVVAARLESLRSEKERLEEELGRMDAQIGARRDFLAGMDQAPISPSVAPPPSDPRAATEDAGLDRAIRDVEREISDAIVIKQMTPEHPTIQTLRRKLAALESVRSSRTQDQQPPPSKLAQAEPAVAAPAPRNPLVVQVTLEVDTLDRQREIVETRLAAAREAYARHSALCRDLNASRGELRRLDERAAQATAAAGVWRQHLAQLEQIAAAESEERGTRFTLLEEPLTAAQPLTPRLSAVFAICIGLALSGAIALVMLLELLDRSVSDVGRAAKLAGAPVLEVIGEIATPATVRARRLRTLVWTPAIAINVALLVFSASLAYTSIGIPGVHHRIGVVMDRILRPLGIPPIADASADFEEAAWER
ncbi:MAG: hypothetical protein HZB38_11370 [Planctomycetes bacterium]|nr:hypothetical protein [Planctomycetota bacterium]